MAADLTAKLRGVLSTAVFVVVVLSSAAAGWALIEHSATDPASAVRDQLPVTAASGVRSPSIDVAAIDDAVPVLAYGAVDRAKGPASIDPATFARHLDVLDAAGFETVSLDDVADLVAGRDVDLPARPVLITFDGTHRSAWTTVDPLLAEHGFRAVAFVDPDLVVDRTTSVRLTGDELHAMRETGRWTIALGVRDVLTEDDDDTPEALRTRIGSLIDARSAALDEQLDGTAADALAYTASGPGATEAAFQAGQVVGDDVALAFTTTGTDLATPRWPTSGLPRISTTGLSEGELLRRIINGIPRAPQGLDAPPDPDAPPVVVSLSWDDGRASAYRSLAIQQRHGVAATYFINSDQIGSSPYYLSRGQLDDLEATGNEIGGHTIGHVNVTEIDPADAREAICVDRAVLAEWYGDDALTTFAFPFGSNGKTQDQVAACGYRFARITTGLQGPLGCTACPAVESLPAEDEFAIRASGSVQADWTLADLQRLVLRAEAQGGGWVNYVLHAVSSDPADRYAISPETYDALLAWLAARPNVTVEPVGTAAARTAAG